MGPVETELRKVGGQWWKVELPEAASVFDGAILSVELNGPDGSSWKHLADISEDVMSEAIEAAAALGL